MRLARLLPKPTGAVFRRPSQLQRRDFCFGKSSWAQLPLMNSTRDLQRQAPWTPFVVASAALGLALYYMHTRHSPTASAAKPSQVNATQPCQDSDADHRLQIMSAQDRAYHERFMREAIAMVNHTCAPSPVRMLTHHLHRRSSPSRATKHLSAVSLSRTARSLAAA